jgi:molybdopterin molybdotransferase
MISYDEALQKVLGTVSPLEPIEKPLDESQGLVLALSAVARWDMPRSNNSAMDGFAISGGPEQSEAGLEIIGASYAGHPFPGEVSPGHAVRITTGAALPKGADTVVAIEDVDEKNDRIYLATTPEAWHHVRYQGEEYHSGDTLVEEGTILRAGEIALLASAGVERVQVFPRPRVAVISTGDELVELGQEPGPGKIINSNMHLLRTRLIECGCTPVCTGIGVDDPGTLDRLIEQALDADLIISTGGVSVGDKDLVQAALGHLAFRKIFWKVAIKPGKPLLFGMLEGKPFFGLPGNPAATAATFELFAKPALRRLAGKTNALSEKRLATLTSEVTGAGNRQAFLWCQLEWHEDGYKVTPSKRQGSGQNRCLTAANAILPVPVGTDKLKSGNMVEILLL